MEMKRSFYVFLAIYLAAIVVEILYSYKTKKRLYDVKDSFVNIFLGVSGVLTRALTKGVWLALWMYLYQFSVIKITENVWSWIVLFLLNEFVYYWFHRFSHTNKYLWAVHVNHHSSQELNFTTAARVPFFNLILHNLFWIPLVIIGFNPIMIFTVENIGFLFSFIQHTQIIKKIPYVDYVLNTPSHHRVHHSSNEAYINKNYGNTLIIFDRLFGSFTDEREDIKIQYGVPNNINSYNPIKVIFHEWVNLFQQWRNK
jgi:sterol desaturase/sphingolipid hydroxylase (fatty acid hydroxylase superfamily)